MTRTVPYRAARTCCDGDDDPIEYHLPENKTTINQFDTYGRCGECDQLITDDHKP